MKIIVIAAAGMKGEIGRGNQLIWKIPADMKHFRETTLHHAVLMGRKTFESIGQALPNRHNYVMSRSISEDSGVFGGESYNLVGSLPVAVDNAKRTGYQKLFVIGGGEIYDNVIRNGLAHEIILTRIAHTADDADAFFPDIQASTLYQETHLRPLNDYADVYTYTRTDLI